MAQWIGQWPTQFTLVRPGGKYHTFRIPPMPDDGWVIAINFAYDTWNSTDRRVSMGFHRGDGDLIWGVGPITLPSSGGPGRAVQYAFYNTGGPGGLRVNAGEQIWPGVHTAGELGFIGDINNMSPGGGSNWNELDWPYGNPFPTDPIPGHRSYAPQIQIQLEFQRQEIPSKPVFISPTPAEGSITNTTSPSVRFTLPHPESQDDSTQVELEVFVSNTGQRTIYTYNVSAGDNANGYFTVSPSSFSPGRALSYRARHKDTWNDWSEFSDYRNFTIRDDPPGKGVWLSPTPAEGALVTDSTPTIKGSTPHPGLDSSYDFTTQVQIELVDAQTNATFQNFIIAVPAAEQAQDVFNWTLDPIAQNTDVMMRFRHQGPDGHLVCVLRLAYLLHLGRT